MATLLRSFLLTAVVLGLARLLGFPVFDWIASTVQLLCYVCSALLWAVWQLLQPDEETNSSLPELHQAVLNVTRDATRVADLLDEFMLQYREDPKLREKFLAFMAAQANTQYSVVDNKLSWVLWLYSLIWMPLLVLMCLTRLGGGAARAEKRTQQQAAAHGNNLHSAWEQQGPGNSIPGGPPTGLRQSSGSMQAPMHAASAFASAVPAGVVAGGTPQLTPRRVVSAGGSLDFGTLGLQASGAIKRGPEDGNLSLRSAASSGRSLQRSMTAGAPRRQHSLRASSDRLHVSRASKLQQYGSLPPQGLNAGGSSSGSGMGWRAMQGDSSQQPFGSSRSTSFPGVYGSGQQLSSNDGGDVWAATAVDQAGNGSGSCGGMRPVKHLKVPRQPPDSSGGGSSSGALAAEGPFAELGQEPF